MIKYGVADYGLKVWYGNFYDYDERIDFVITEYPINKYDYTIVTFDANESIVEKIIAYIESLTSNNEVIRGIIPINVCAHCGPGTIGIIISPRINDKSLKEFSKNYYKDF